MGSLATGLDMAMKDMGLAAGGMLAAAAVFPECLEISKVGGWGIGGPGTLIEGAQHWLEGAQALQQAQQSLESACTGLSSEQWSGADRDGFDHAISELSAQLGVSHGYAQMVGAVLAGLATPLLAFPPTFLASGVCMLSFSIAFEAAVASVVGNVGVSESIYAEGTAVAVIWLEAINGFVLGITAAMGAAAIAIEIADLVDVTKQKQHGDSDAGDTFQQAQVDGLGEVAENVEGWAVGQAAGWAGGKVGESAYPGGNPADELARWGVSTGYGEVVGNENSALVDIVKGEDAGTVITDTLGITPQVELGEAVARKAQEAGDELLNQVPDNLGELINRGVNFKQH